MFLIKVKTGYCKSSLPRNDRYESGDFWVLSTIMLLISRRRASYYYI